MITTNEKVEITPAHIEAIRNKYPNAKDANDEQIVNAMCEWEAHFNKTGESRSILSLLAFPSFNDFMRFKINK